VKKVEAIVATSKLDAIRTLLERIGADSMTVTEVRGYGEDYAKERRHTERYRGQEHHVLLSPKVKVEVVVEDSRVPALLADLSRVTWTGKVGDGKIFVIPVDDALRIRTGERGKDAL
jgi:nitrogen regulatory protein P-II 1